MDTNSIDPQINELVKEQILDFNEEEKIKNNIKRIYKINNSISKVVKKQYENNPYHLIGFLHPSGSPPSFFEVMI